MEYYSTQKGNELYPSKEKTRRNFKCILLNKENQPEKILYIVWFQLYDTWNVRKL